MPVPGSTRKVWAASPQTLLFFGKCGEFAPTLLDLLFYGTCKMCCAGGFRFLPKAVCDPVGGGVCVPFPGGLALLSVHRKREFLCPSFAGSSDSQPASPLQLRRSFSPPRDQRPQFSRKFQGRCRCLGWLGEIGFLSIFEAIVNMNRPELQKVAGFTS